MELSSQPVFVETGNAPVPELEQQAVNGSRKPKAQPVRFGWVTGVMVSKHTNQQHWGDIMWTIFMVKTCVESSLTAEMLKSITLE